jgi:hypothetical protein
MLKPNPMWERALPAIVLMLNSSRAGTLPHVQTQSYVGAGLARDCANAELIACRHAPTH